MAFSTQKDFLPLSFALNRKKSENQIKTYESCTDTRAWSMDITKRAKYLAENVQKKKNIPAAADDGGGDGSRYFSEIELKEMTQIELIAHVLEIYRNIQSKTDELRALKKDAAQKCDSIDNIIRENKELIYEIQTSKDKIIELENLKDENLQERLSHELIEKVEVIQDLRNQNKNLKSQLGAVQSSSEELSQLRKRSEILDMVIKERKNSTENSKNMEMIEDAMVRLKEKALLADQLAEENQRMCQVLEIMKNKLQDVANDENQVKLEAQNRFMKDRLVQVESLMEEISMYKAENVTLHKQINDFRQKMVTLKLLETELYQVQELLRRRDVEVNDCETIIHKCMIRIEQQEMEIKIGRQRMQKLFKMQEDLKILHDHLGITDGNDVDSESRRIREISCEKDFVHSSFEENSLQSEKISMESPENRGSYEGKTEFSEDQMKSCQITVNKSDDSKNMEEIHELRQINEKLLLDVQTYEKDIQSLQLQLKTLEKSRKSIITEVQEKTDNLLVHLPSVSNDTDMDKDEFQKRHILIEKIDACNQSKDEAERKLIEISIELKALEDKNQLLEEENETWKQKIGDFEEEIQKQKLLNDILKAQNTKLNSKLDSSLNSKENATTDNLDTMISKDNSKEEILILQNEIEKKEAEIEALRDDFEKQLKSVLEISDALKIQIDEIRAEKDSCIEQLEKAKLEKDSLQTQVSEIGAITEDLEQERNENKLYEKQRITELENEVERLNEHLKIEIQKGKEREEKNIKTEDDIELVEKLIEASDIEQLTSERNIEDILSDGRSKMLEAQPVRESLSYLQIDTSEATASKNNSLLQNESSIKLSDVIHSKTSTEFLESVQENQAKEQNELTDDISVEKLQDEEIKCISQFDNRSINEELRKSYERASYSMNQRYVSKIQELQQLHEIEKKESNKKHDAEMDTLRLQIQAFECELKKNDERCKCGRKISQSVFNTDVRICKICRDVLQYGLEPCLDHDLLYLKEMIEKAIEEKRKKLCNDRVKHLVNDCNNNLEDTKAHVQNIKQLIEDEIPVKLSARKIPFAQPVPSYGSFSVIPKQKGSKKVKKFQTRESNTTKPRINNNNTHVMRLNMSKVSTNYEQTKVLFHHHGNKIIKITDKSNVHHSNSGKSVKGLHQR